MGVLLVLRSHFPPQPVDKFFGGVGGGVQVLCRYLQKCTSLFCGNKEDHLPYELHVHSYDLLDSVLKNVEESRYESPKMFNVV